MKHYIKKIFIAGIFSVIYVVNANKIVHHIVSNNTPLSFHLANIK